MTPPVKIFHTTRSFKGDYNITIRVNEDKKLTIAMDVGTTGHAIVLTDTEAAAFWNAMQGHMAQTITPQNTPSDGIPPHELSTCGNAYLASERALRIVENASALGEAMSAEAIEQITNLAHEAGAACNRVALRRHPFADEHPF